MHPDDLETGLRELAAAQAPASDRKDEVLALGRKERQGRRLAFAGATAVLLLVVAGGYALLSDGGDTEADVASGPGEQETCATAGTIEVAVPDVTGMNLGEARQAAEAVGLVVAGAGVPAGDSPDDGASVQTQFPLPAASVPSGSCIGFRTGAWRDQPSLRAAITLSAYEVPSGDKVAGAVTVENNGDGPIAITYCIDVFNSVLSNEAIPQEVISFMCAHEGSLPVGVSTYDITVSAQYVLCGGEGGDLPPCEDGRPPGLPAGTYDVIVATPGRVPAVPPVQVDVVEPVLSEPVAVDDESAIIAAALVDRVTTSNSFGGEDVATEVLVIDRIGSADDLGMVDMGSDAVHLSAATRDQIVTALTPVPVRFVTPEEASAFQTSAMHDTAATGTPFVVSTAEPEIDGDRALITSQVWCGGLCGTGGAQVVERQLDGSWIVTGSEGPQWIS